MHDGFAMTAFAYLPHGDVGGLALVAAMLLAGAVGGLTHCVGMCGPFVLAQTTARLESVPAAQMREFHRLAGAALAPYHLGRGTTYIALGAMAGTAGQGIRMIPGLDWVAAGWLVFAALMFLAYAIFGSGLLRAAAAKEGRWGQALGRHARPLFARPTGLRGYALGLMLGFLPCGLLYAALAVAAGSGGALGGATAMAAFVLGTMPGLVAVGLSGHVAAGRWRRVAAVIAPVLMVVNAAMLAFAAWRLVA
ncbi:MAG: sulfite exporter TauE/SafE family protein [Alphaproteobacteria bacterium]|nr:sulfite exporter TauE/SafE family protein [Alphaproteobacteria bacterium]